MGVIYELNDKMVKCDCKNCVHKDLVATPITKNSVSQKREMVAEPLAEQGSVKLTKATLSLPADLFDKGV